MKYMIEARRLGGWEDGQWEDDDGPLRFDTIEEGPVRPTCHVTSSSLVTDE